MNIAALTAGLFSGITGAMGLGGGTVLLIYLTVFSDTEQLKAQGINLMFFIPIAAAAVTVYTIRHKIQWKITVPIAFGGTAGAVLSIFAAQYSGGKLTSQIFGILLIILGIREIFRKGTEIIENRD